MCVGVSVWLGWSGIRVASACNTDTTPTQPHRNSNTLRTKNNTTNVVVQQNSRKLLMMDILMSEKCRAHKQWNKIASDIKLVFYSLTIICMHFISPNNVKHETHLYPSFVWCETDVVYRAVQYRLCWSEKVQEHFCDTELSLSQFGPDTQYVDMARVKVYPIIDLA